MPSLPLLTIPTFPHLPIKDDVDVSGFQRDVLNKYHSNVQDANTVVNFYLVNYGNYKPYVLVTSCPGDAHGGAHTRVSSYTNQMRWKFAPVQFTNKRDADDWCVSLSGYPQGHSPF